MPHSVKQDSSNKQHTVASYSSNTAGAGANNMAGFASQLDAMQAKTMMQVWHEERNPSNLTFSECTQLRGEVRSGGGGGSKKNSSRRK
ncbi:hypothetical protein RB601_005933 [Gaeumannomyces tritici]